MGQHRIGVPGLDQFHLRCRATLAQVADARNAQLKHVRKTDGKNDPALDTTEASATKVLAGEVFRVYPFRG